MTIETAKYILNFYDKLFSIEYKNELSRFQDVRNYYSFIGGETNEVFLKKARLHYHVTEIDLEK